MTHNSPIKPMTCARYALMILALALVGCNRDKVTVQEVPSGQWGIAGKALTTGDVVGMRQS